MSVWWLIIPTLIYVAISRNLLLTGVLVAVGAAIKFAQTRPEIPQAARDFLPLLQSFFAFVFFGGNPIVVAAVAGAAVAAFLNLSAIVRALAPWWQVQQQVPTLARRIAAGVLSLLIGYAFGINASGAEWTFTFLSIAFASVVTFLLVFNPPASAPDQTGRPVA